MKAEQLIEAVRNGKDPMDLIQEGRVKELSIRIDQLLQDKAPDLMKISKQIALEFDITEKESFGFVDTRYKDLHKQEARNPTNERGLEKYWWKLAPTKKEKLLKSLSLNSQLKNSGNFKALPQDVKDKLKSHFGI